jgi:PAS domain S-box-containing protein
MRDRSSQLELKIQDLENRLEESEQLIEAIKAGEVDAFAINKENNSEIYTLQSGDYAYRILIEEFGEGAINVTEDGLIVYTNPYFFDLLNLSYEDVIGSSIFDLIHTDSLKEFNRLFKESLQGKSKGEIILAFKNTAVPVYVSLTSLQPKLATVGIIITDLTEKKKNEKMILNYQRDLELKNFELLQSNAELASFAFVASHDLQEPLRKIQTFATLITEKESKNLSDSGIDHFKRMKIAAKRMQNLIEDLLTYSRTSTVERKYENTNLNKIIEEVKADLKEEIQQKKASIATTGTCEINALPYQFYQLFQNLIANSLKYSNPDRSPLIKIKSEIIASKEVKGVNLSHGEKYCHIQIADNGLGFDQEYSEKIFELFRRLYGRTEYEGTGIGLAIVKKVVDNHNGIITAKGVKNEGATFDIYIPAS